MKLGEYALKVKAKRKEATATLKSRYDKSREEEKQVWLDALCHEAKTRVDLVKLPKSDEVIPLFISDNKDRPRALNIETRSITLIKKDIITDYSLITTVDSHNRLILWLVNTELWDSYCNQESFAKKITDRRKDKEIQFPDLSDKVVDIGVIYFPLLVAIGSFLPIYNFIYATTSKSSANYSGSESAKNFLTSVEITADVFVSLLFSFILAFVCLICAKGFLHLIQKVVKPKNNKLISEVGEFEYVLTHVNHNLLK